MADVELEHAGNHRDGSNVVVIEPVPRMQPQAEVIGDFPRGHKRRQLLLLSRSASECVLACVQLDSFHSELLGELNLPRIGIDEQADGDSRRLQPFHGAGDRDQLGAHIKASLGRHFFASLGDESCLIRFGLAGDADDFIGDGELQVELRRDGLSQQPQVPVLDVAAVLAKMDRDAVRSRQLGEHCRGDGVRLWYSSGCRLAGNHVERSRDVIVWYSAGTVVEDNVVRTMTGTAMIANAKAPAQPEKWPIGLTITS